MKSFTLRWFPLVPYPSCQLSSTHIYCVLSSSISHVAGTCGFLSHPPSPGPSMPLLLASNAAGEDATHIKGDPGCTEPSAFLSFLQGRSYKPFGLSCHDLVLWEWKHHRFSPGDPRQRPRLSIAGIRGEGKPR